MCWINACDSLLSRNKTWPHLIYAKFDCRWKHTISFLLIYNIEYSACCSIIYLQLDMHLHICFSLYIECNDKLLRWYLLFCERRDWMWIFRRTFKDLRFICSNFSSICVRSFYQPTRHHDRHYGILVKWTTQTYTVHCLIINNTCMLETILFHDTVDLTSFVNSFKILLFNSASVVRLKKKVCVRLGRWKKKLSQWYCTLVTFTG